MPYAFDKAEIQTQGGKKFATPEQFLKIPLATRIKLLNSQSVRFLKKTGESVPAAVAVKSLLAA